MIVKSNFSMEQYKTDIQSAYDCGRASATLCEDAPDIDVSNMILEGQYAQGYNDAKREIASSGEYERAYERGKADAQTGKWIPVSERLPEEDGKYLVSELVYSSSNPRGYGYKPLGNEVDFVEFSTVNGWRRARSLYDITAWMPLPQPYKAESEDNNASSN